MIQRAATRGRRAMFAPAVKVGDWAFAGGVLPTDWETGLLPAARTPPGYPYHADRLGLQSGAVLTLLRQALQAVDLEPDSIVRLTQWFAGTEDWPAGSEWSGIRISSYLETRARDLPRGDFASIAVAARRLPVAGALVCVEAMAAARGERVPIPAPGRPYPAGLRVGDMVHLSGELPADWRGERTDPVAAEARVEPDLWYGHPVRAQADLVLRRLARLAEEAGTNLERCAHATVFLPDRRDLPDLEEVWRRHFPGTPPARTLITGAGLACRGCRVEIALDLLASHAPQPVRPAALPLPPAHESPAVVAEDLLYLSGQMAVGLDGPDPRGLADPAFPDLHVPVVEQLKIVLDRMQAICEAAGTSLDNLVCAHLYLSDLNQLGLVLPVWEQAFGKSRPAGSAVGIGLLPVPGCVVMMDGIAHLPRG